MTDFERWLKELDAAEAAALVPPATKDDTTQPLSEIDQAVHDLCAGYSEAALLAAAAAAPTFTEKVAANGAVEEAYERLLGIADQLAKELALRGWNESKGYIDAHMEQLQIAHNSGQMPGLASSIARSLGKFKALCEICASRVEKKQSSVADLGDLFLLTGQSADELRQAMSEVYDC